jgi:hypothetical protein
MDLSLIPKNYTTLDLLANSNYGESVSGKAISPENSEMTKACQLQDNGAVKLELSDRAVMGDGHPTTQVSHQEGLNQIQMAGELLAKVESLLETGKGLAEKASDTKCQSDKQALQVQVDAVNQQIDQLSASAGYKDISLLSTATASSQNKAVIDCLERGWLEEGEKVIAERYGLSADGADIEIILDETPEPYLAAMEYNYSPDGKAANEKLHIVVSSALPATLPNGGKGPYYDDRIVTHELVHAVMGRTMNFRALPCWFKEGTAEFIHGADERVGYDLARNGGGKEGAETIQDAIGDGTDGDWVNDSKHYSAASMAVRYLHEKIKADGHSGGIKDLLEDMEANPTENLDQALSHVSHYGSVKEFVTDFVADDNGEKFIHKLDMAGEFVKALSGGDTGAIGGSSTDGGPVQTASSVIPDINNLTSTPLKNFKVEWPELNSNGGDKAEGGNNQGIKLNYKTAKIDSAVLGTRNVDLVNDSSKAVAIFDNALAYVAAEKDELSSLLDQLYNQGSSVAAGNSPVQGYPSAQRALDSIKFNLDKIIGTQKTQSPEMVMKLLNIY